MDHSATTAACSTCHNGTTATGKPGNHIQSTNTCDDCHTTNAWVPANMDHSDVTAACSTCHNGTTATGKPGNHVQTSSPCDNCHTTLAWVPASFDHTNAAGSCSTCHNGTTATGKPVTHFVTSLQCDECHSTSSWIPTTAYSHTSSYYPDHGSKLICMNCHTSNSQTIPWPSPAYQPDCAGCHANDYEPSHHQNASVSSLRNCAGTCHQSTPEHNAKSKEW